MRSSSRSLPKPLRNGAAAFALLALGTAWPSVPVRAQEQSIAACVGAEQKADRDGSACIGRRADPCLEKPEGQSTHGSVECIRAETREWDAIMNEEYRALLAAVDKKTADKAREAQRLWVRSRDADCALPYALFEGGSMAQPMMAGCLQDRTARRALVIMRWREAVGAR